MNRCVVSAGDVYMGMWCRGRMEGRGAKSCADGSSLRGHFRDGLLDGPGVKARPAVVCLCVYVCVLLSVLLQMELTIALPVVDKGHGGAYIYIVLCECTGGRSSRGEIATPEGSARAGRPSFPAPIDLTHTHITCTTDGLSRHGFGRYVWSTGDVYEGQWEGDRLSGTGHMRLSDSAR